MIDYKLFTFSAPPLTGVDWFIQAAQLAGLGPGFKYHAYDLFQGDSHDRLRVSLVRHPCDWLGSCWLAMRSGKVACNHLGRFGSLGLHTLDLFIYEYLKLLPGGVGRLYDTYQADTCMRIEDQPWAFVELAESLGVPATMLSRVGRLRPAPHALQLPNNLRRRVFQAEREIMERYDYF